MQRAIHLEDVIIRSIRLLEELKPKEEEKVVPKEEDKPQDLK